jgi:hypothetical protein
MKQPFKDQVSDEAERSIAVSHRDPLQPAARSRGKFGSKRAPESYHSHAASQSCHVICHLDKALMMLNGA